MNEENIPKLQDDFLKLVNTALPNLRNNALFTERFSRHLAKLTEIWATNPDLAEKYESFIYVWLDSLEKSIDGVNVFGDISYADLINLDYDDAMQIPPRHSSQLEISENEEPMQM